MADEENVQEEQAAEEATEEAVEAGAEGEPEEEAEPEIDESWKERLAELDLKKPLEKMTVKELRQLVVEKKLSGITGAVGLDKETLLQAVKDELGIPPEAEAPNPYKDRIRAVKSEIKDLIAMRPEMGAKSREERKRFREKIARLKRKTRRLAKAS